MPRAYSNDLRMSVVAYVEAGNSCHEAAENFGTSVSFAVNVMRRWRDTATVDAKSRGGFRRGKLAPHKDFILSIVAATGDITMPELAAKLLAAKGVTVDPSNLSKFLIRCGLSFKKNTARQRAGQARTGQAAGRMERRPSTDHAQTAPADDLH